MEPVVALYWALPLIVIYLTILYYYRRLDSSIDTAHDGLTGTADDPIDQESGIVDCLECGAENELGYSYCYNCVGELPGESVLKTSGTSPGQRGIL